MRDGGSDVTATSTGGSGFRFMKHSSFFHSKSWLGEALAEETSQARVKTYSPHLNDHRKETFPTSLSSTMVEGLKSSRSFVRLVGLGELPLINNDPDIGSGRGEGKNNSKALRG